jgi:hypothetical protein
MLTLWTYGFFKNCVTWEPLPQSNQHSQEEKHLLGFPVLLKAMTNLSFFQWRQSQSPWRCLTDSHVNPPRQDIWASWMGLQCPGCLLTLAFGERVLFEMSGVDFFPWRSWWATDIRAGFEVMGNRFLSYNKWPRFSPCTFSTQQSIGVYLKWLWRYDIPTWYFRKKNTKWLENQG